MQFTMLVAGILGAIAITGEYSTGMIRSTFAAEPRRGAVLLAKALVVAVVLAVTTILTSVIAVATTAPIVSDSPIDWADATQSTIPLLMSILAMVTFALIARLRVPHPQWGRCDRRDGRAAVRPPDRVQHVRDGRRRMAVDRRSREIPADVGRTGRDGARGDDILRGALTLVAWPAALLVGAWGVLRTRDARLDSVTRASRSSSEDDSAELRLPRPPGVIRRFWARHPRFADVLIALLCVVFSFPPMFGYNPDSNWAAWDAARPVVIVVVLCAAVLAIVRRRWPFAFYGGTLAATIAYLFTPGARQASFCPPRSTPSRSTVPAARRGSHWGPRCWWRRPWPHRSSGRR
jgi:ABC-2 type transport system permease protein